jgi:hypothetical protein
MGAATGPLWRGVYLNVPKADDSESCFRFPSLQGSGITGMRLDISEFLPASGRHRLLVDRSVVPMFKHVLKGPKRMSFIISSRSHDRGSCCYFRLPTDRP